jgi:hypothetical protein
VAFLGLGATCGRGKLVSTEDRLDEAVRLRGLALAQMEDQRYDLAIGYLEALAEILPDNVLPPVNLAICFFRLNRRDDAFAQLERARQLDPDNPRTFYTLARVLEEDRENREEWLQTVRAFAASHPHDSRPYYLEAELLARERRYGEAIPLLLRALEEERENLVLLSDLLVAAAAEAEIEILTDALNALEDRLDGFDGSLASFAGELRDAASRQDREGIQPPALILRNLLRPSELYQVHLAPLIGGRQLGGSMFPQLDFDPPLPKSVQGGKDIDLEFVDATASLPTTASSTDPQMIIGREPDIELVLGLGAQGIALWSETELLRVEAGIDSTAVHGAMLLAVDGDVEPDLVTAGPGTGVQLHQGIGGGLFGPAQQIWRPDGSPDLTVNPVDLDHDGDLDLLVTRPAAPDLYLQNNGDGSWSERGAELGIAGGSVATGQVALADFDEDGDLDLLTVHPESHPRLYLNPRVGPFENATQAWRLADTPGADSVLSADFNNDGAFDLLLWGRVGNSLLLNRGRWFEDVSLPAELPASWDAAAIADFDNDGDQDIVVVAGPDHSPILVRNRRGEFTLEPIDLEVGSASRLMPADLDHDGDLDLVVGLESGDSLFWRNQGGNRNHWLRLVLKGRHDNNSKNNVQGLFCRIESRVAGAFQVVHGNGGVNHLGLGARRQAEVLRVVWTNGIAQLWQLVSADRTLVEEQMLKGSCPFLYAWNGQDFEFVTDLMWKSPLGMMLADGTPAPHQSARDFVLIPAESLQLDGDDVWLQVTAELWETVYLDRQMLVAVDHPAALELVVDESFRPPPYSRQAPIHWISSRSSPVAAIDHNGRDVLTEILHRDQRHVDQLPLSRYQGLTEGHSLELTFSDVPAGQRLRLLLAGWTFPTDTTINFALAQDSSRNPDGPRLDLLNEGGTWTVLSPFIGFPNGKRKAVVVDLTDRLPVGEVTLRLVTSMQIYWDVAELAIGDPRPRALLTTLEPENADLHYRGYSRLHRSSASSPHLFDYGDVTHGPRFRDMRGAFTRYGRVTDLLHGEDDRYVVMNAGDEMTVRFDASGLPPVASGWRRDWILYTDGWVKDADIHTAYSQTVEPLPYHGQDGYPGRSGHDYPSTPEHRRYLENYQTRQISDQAFRDALER